MAQKTKSVDGEDLPSSAFLIVGDPEDTSTWKLPWKFSSPEKTKSHLQNAVARFNQMTGVSQSAKQSAWTKLKGLCKSHGIEISETMMPRSAEEMSTGYSWLNVRAVDEEKRIIRGIATTPSVARDKDILETTGIAFKLPIPFLWRHREPFGNVVSANVDPAKGIDVEIHVAPAGVSSTIDEYWRLVRSGTVRGLSIGWRTLQETFDKAIGGYRIQKSEWIELSCVPIPSDPNATITSVRTFDEADLAASGDKVAPPTTEQTRTVPGASGSKRKKGEVMAKTFNEKIKELEERRLPVKERMTALWDKKELETRDFDANEAEEYDSLISDLTEIDDKIRRTRAQAQAAEGAIAVSPRTEQAPVVRTPAIEVKAPELPKGTAMARAVICMVRAEKDRRNPIDLAEHYYGDTPQVAAFLRSRAGVDPGDTTTSGWASQLVPAAQQMQSEFLDLLRPATVIGRIPGLRTVPFNVAVPLQTGGGTYGWVGEGRPKPVTSAAFDRVTLRWAKAAGIIVITDELARFSSPLAEGLIRNEMIQGTARFLDQQFVDSTKAEVTNVSPAGINYNISPKTKSGSNADAFRYDVNQLAAAFIANSQNPATAVILISATTAFALSQMMNALGQPEFPSITLTGGTYAGLPVVVSENIGDRLFLINASDILIADDGGINIDMSNQASVEMSTTPADASPENASVVMRSLWQNNLIGLRVERYVTWKVARSSAIEWIDDTTYAPTEPTSPA